LELCSAKALSYCNGDAAKLVAHVPRHVVAYRRIASGD
jgi:hypothetical protein